MPSSAPGSRFPTTPTCALRRCSTRTGSPSRTSISIIWICHCCRPFRRRCAWSSRAIPRGRCATASPGAGIRNVVIELDAWERLALNDRGDWVTVIPELSPMCHDAAILVYVDGHAVLHTNDARLSVSQLRRAAEEAGRPIDVMGVQMSGASWHPICYDYPPEVVERISSDKRSGQVPGRDAPPPLGSAEDRHAVRRAAGLPRPCRRAPQPHGAAPGDLPPPGQALEFLQRAAAGPDRALPAARRPSARRLRRGRTRPDVGGLLLRRHLRLPARVCRPPRRRDRRGPRRAARPGSGERARRALPRPLPGPRRPVRLLPSAHRHDRPLRGARTGGWHLGRAARTATRPRST